MKKPAGKKGRPRIYGKKVVLKEEFRTEGFTSIKSAEHGSIEIKSKILISRAWGGIPAQYVWVMNKTRVNMTLISSDVDADPYELYQLYTHRFAIEAMFKLAKQHFQAFMGRFWLKCKDKTRFGDLAED